MKGFSLWQPWASLMGAGLKTIETRSWPTRYRGPLAIHAAKRLMTREEKGLIYLWACRGLVPAEWIDEPLPYGAILAVVELVGCIQTEDTFPGPREEAFGNYGPGRWAWITRNLRPLPKAIPYRGAQGLFEIPDSIMSIAAEFAGERERT